MKSDPTLDGPEDTPADIIVMNESRPINESERVWSERPERVRKKPIKFDDYVEDYY